VQLPTTIAETVGSRALTPAIRVHDFTIAKEILPVQIPYADSAPRYRTRVSKSIDARERRRQKKKPRRMPARLCG